MFFRTEKYAILRAASWVIDKLFELEAHRVPGNCSTKGNEIPNALAKKSVEFPRFRTGTSNWNIKLPIKTH